MTTPAESPDDALQALLRAQFPGTTELRAPARLSAGASMETWSFDAAGEAGILPLILRRRPPGAPHADQFRLLSTEAAVIQAAAAGGVPAPTVRYVLQPEDGLGGGFLMQRIEGETIPRRMLRDATLDACRLLQQVGAAAARAAGVERDPPHQVIPPK